MYVKKSFEEQIVAKLEQVEVESPQNAPNGEYQRIYKGICTVMQLHFNQNARMRAKSPQIGGNLHRTHLDLW